MQYIFCELGQPANQSVRTANLVRQARGREDFYKLLPGWFDLAECDRDGWGSSLPTLRGSKLRIRVYISDAPHGKSSCGPVGSIRTADNLIV